MSLSAIDLGIFVTYIFVVMAVGLIAARVAGFTKRDYFLAGDKVPWWMVGGSIVASNISSHHFVGVMGLAYSLGFAAMTVEWGAILMGFNALLWIFLPYYLRNGFFTMPEFLERRFSRHARTSFAALILLTYMFVEITAVLCLGALALNKTLGVSIPVSIVTLAVLTGVYTITGGLRAVIWTEMLQLAVLLTGGLALSFVTIRHVGGWTGVMATSKDWGLFLPASNQAFPWTMWLGGITSISIFYCAANQFIVQRVLAAKDEWHARMGVVWTDYLKFIMPLIILVPGLMARQLFPDLERPDFAFPALVGSLLPHGLVGLVLAGLIAAIMSHISGALNSCTTIAAIDFYQTYINKRATDADSVRFGKWSGVGMLVIGIVWAQWLVKHSEKPMFLYLLDAYGYFAPGITTMFLLGIFWKRATNAGALTAGLLTIPLSILMQILLPGVAGLARASIVFWACMLAAALVSVITSPKPFDEIESLIWRKDSLKLPQEIRYKMRGVRNPAVWWGIVTAMVLFMYVRYPVDRNKPSVTIEPAPRMDSGGLIAFKMTFSEPVVWKKAVSVTGGELADWPAKGDQKPIWSKGNGIVFFARVRAVSPDEVKVRVPDGAAVDQSGNACLRSPEITLRAPVARSATYKMPFFDE